MRCLWRIAHVKWQDHIPNTEVLEICKISGTEVFLISAQLRSIASPDYFSKAQTRSWHDMHWALVGSSYMYLLAFLQAMLLLTDISLS